MAGVRVWVSVQVIVKGVIRVHFRIRVRDRVWVQVLFRKPISCSVSLVSSTQEAPKKKPSQWKSRNL